jgi:gluconokinase
LDAANLSSVPQAIIVMGVAGAGKSTVGATLAIALDWPFLDGDDFHPPANIVKMASGQALNDADRTPWLERLHKLIAGSFAEGSSLVLACSALKEEYRQVLSGDLPNIHYVYLKGDLALIDSRLASRQGHYMKPNLLESQFQTLEEPQDAIVVDASLSLEEKIAMIITKLAD